MCCYYVLFPAFILFFHRMLKCGVKNIVYLLKSTFHVIIALSSTLLFTRLNVSCCICIYVGARGVRRYKCEWCRYNS